ncbi:MAG TPA: hypothetical protein VFY73_25010, partial [Ideonella sp.]|nr:hypothetical protein [Ideonella sp.]
MDSRPISPNPPATEPRFDVFIRLPRGMSPEEAQQRVERAGLTPAQGASICAALRQVPVVQVRKSIDELRARKTEHQLSLAGLKVEVKRVPKAAQAAGAPVIPDASHESADTTALAPPVAQAPAVAAAATVAVVQRVAAAPATPSPPLPPAPPAVPPAPAPPPPRLERQHAEDPEDFEFNLQPGPDDDEDTIYSPQSTRPATQPGPSTELPPRDAP